MAMMIVTIAMTAWMTADDDDGEDCDDDDNDSDGDDDNDSDGDEHGDDDDIDDDGYDDCFAAMSISESGIDKQQNHTNENSQVFLGTLSNPVDLCSPTRGLDGWVDE